MRKFEFLEVKSVVGFCKDNLLITVNMPEMQRFCLSCFGLKIVYNKQLLDDAEYDMKNDADRGGCYPPKTRLKVDNTLRDLHTFIAYETEFNNC